MGECTSRPTAQEIQEHMAGLNSKNDSYFRYAPFHTITNDQISIEKNLHSLDNKCKLFKKKKSEYLGKLESTNHGLMVIPELNIEVQKGVNLNDLGMCLSKGKPYVVISLEPNGPRIETFESDVYKPYWYRLVQFKQIISYSKIVFRVMKKRSYSSDVCISTIEVKICEINDQMVKEGWFTADVNNKAAPAIRLRIQYVYDEKLLLKKIIDNCDEKVDLIKETIRKIQDASHNSN